MAEGAGTAECKARKHKFAHSFIALPATATEVKAQKLCVFKDSKRVRTYFLPAPILCGAGRGIKKRLFKILLIYRELLLRSATRCPKKEKIDFDS